MNSCQTGGKLAGRDKDMTVGNQYISDMEPTEPIMKDTIDGGGKNMFVDYHNSM